MAQSTATPTADVQSHPPSRARPSSRALRRVVLAIAAAAAIAASAAWLRRDALRERWLASRSTDTLREMAAQAGSDSLLQLVYARRLMTEGQEESARAPADAAVAALPKDARGERVSTACSLAGYLAAAQGDQATAEADLSRAQASSDGTADIFSVLGRSILDMQGDRKTEALAALASCTQSNPDSARAWRWLGRLYLVSAEPELAIDALRRSATLAPKDPAIHSDLGQAYLQTKQVDQALAEYKTVAALKPNDRYSATLPLRVIAFAASSEPAYRDARSQLEAALSLSPGDDGLRAELAGLQMRFNRFAEARAELQTLLDHNPDAPQSAWLNLYTVCRRMGDGHAANEAINRVRQMAAARSELTALVQQSELHPDDARLAFHLSVALLRAGQVERAYAALSHAAALAPNDPEITQAMVGAQSILQSRRGPSAKGARTKVE